MEIPTFIEGAHRRLVRVIVTAELVADALVPGPGAHIRVQEGLPAGARLTWAGLSRGGDLELVFEHESFDEVSEGTMPTVTPTLGRLACSNAWPG